MCITDGGERHEEKVEALRAENLHLRQLVGELLLKNQRLRDVAVKGLLATEAQEAAS